MGTDLREMFGVTLYAAKESAESPGYRRGYRYNAPPGRNTIRNLKIAAMLTNEQRKALYHERVLAVV